MRFGRSALPLFALIAVISACSSQSSRTPDESDEILARASSAIINGSLDADHPAVVALIISKGTQGGLCSGTIVKVDAQRHIGWVVTAAHCVEGTPSLVIQGADIQAADALRYDVIDFKADARWSGQTASAYDFAVVRIAGVDATTPVITLGTSTDGLGNGAAVTSVGYGRTSLGSTPDQNTQRRVVNKNLNQLNSTHIGFDMSTKGICQGDSGGPVIKGAGAAERVVGVHSYVTGDCDGQGVSGRVTSAADSFFNTELTKALPPDSCVLCEKVANSGKNECAALSASCLADTACKGYYECLSEKPKADCIKQFPLAEGPFLAAANCVCTRACASTCGPEEYCKTAPKCGYANEKGDCSTCIEASCCAEEIDCAANGQCYVCLKTKDKDPACANNAARKKLATCAATKCTTQCAGAPIGNGAEPPPEEEVPAEEAPPAAPGPTTIVKKGCSASPSSLGNEESGGGGLMLALGAIVLATRRKRRAA